MKLRSFSSLLAAAILMPMLTGCSLFVRTRKLPTPLAPETLQTATAPELVDRLNVQWKALSSLNATVEIKASLTKQKEGVAKDYTSVHGYVLMRKPGMLRLLGMTPYIGTKAFDLATDGDKFKLVIPYQSKVIIGSNASTKKSANAFENLRPAFFFDAMAVRGLNDDDLYSVTADTKTNEDLQKKHLLITPEYELNIVRRKSGGQELIPSRVIRFHREDLLPYEQDLYDAKGNLETQVLYGPYKDFNGLRYPETVTIRRPLEEIQVVLTIDKVQENQTLNDEQFAVKTPDGYKIQDLDK